MKSFHTYSPASLSHHRLAGVPLHYSPKVKTPLALRIQGFCWRAFFGCWMRLRLKTSENCRPRNLPNQALS